MNIVIIGGSVRDERQNGKALRFARESLKQRGHDVSVIDPKEDEFPLLNKMWKEYEEGEAPDVLERGAQKIKEADGVLLVSPEYNHSVPPALKNVLDHYLDIFFHAVRYYVLQRRIFWWRASYDRVAQHRC